MLRGSPGLVTLCYPLPCLCPPPWDRRLFNAKCAQASAIQKKNQGADLSVAMVNHRYVCVARGGPPPGPGAIGKHTTKKNCTNFCSSGLEMCA